jgi:hypothetical protein
MDTTPATKPAWHPSVLVAVASGVAFAAWLLPASMRDPREWRWLMAGDAAQHQFGWWFFRHEAWQWPPGRLWSFGETMGSSIVYTDSIPLLALAGKLLSPLLPEPVQYAGPWIVACYALAAAFAWRCGVLATGRPLAGLLLAAFAVLVPALALRAGDHFALAGQWIVLWSIAHYLEPGPRVAAWPRIACLVVAALVHAYLLFIALAVFGAESLRRWQVLRQHDLRAALGRVAAAGVAVAGAMALAGYFVVGDPGAGDRQYGQYGADLDAWFSSLAGARFAPHWPPSGERGLEGLHYLGAGVLAALALAVAAGAGRVPAGLRTHWPLVLAATLLAALAVTHRIGLGGQVVATLPLPDEVLARLSTFRGSGRFLWLADWLLVVCAVVLPFRWLAPRRATLVVLACLAVQVADLALPLAAFRDSLARMAQQRAARELPASPFWAEATPHYRRLSVVPMAHAPRGWEALAATAVRAGWAIDTGQFARTAWPAWRREREWQLASLQAGLLEPHTLYVVADPALVNLDALPADTAVGRIDGFWVVAPGWRGCCLGAAPADAPFARAGAPAPTLRVRGAQVERSVGLWDDGWAGERAGLSICADGEGTLVLRLRQPEALDGTDVPRVSANSLPAEPQVEPDGVLRYDVPVAAGERVVLRIDAARSWTPAGAGAGADRRTLAWLLVDAAVVP